MKKQPPKYRLGLPVHETSPLLIKAGWHEIYELLTKKARER